MRISLRKYGTIGKSFVENCSQIVCSDFATNIGMVSPGTHLVKNHESQSMPASTNKSHFKKQWSESYIENASAFMLKSPDS